MDGGDPQISPVVGQVIQAVTQPAVGTPGAATPPVTSGLIIQLDGANRGVTANQWDDLSGNGNHFTAASAGEFPTFDVNGASFVNANSTHLDGPNLSALTEGEMFVRVKVVADVTTMGWGFWGTHFFSEHHPVSAAGQSYFGFGSTTRRDVGIVTQRLSWHTMDLWSAANDWACYIDGVSQSTDGTNTVSFPTAVRLGMSTDLHYFTGYMRYVAVYDRKLSGAERTQMNTFMDDLIS